MKRFDVLDYKIEISRGDNGDYIARIPRLGCIADGKTINDAINELKEVAEVYLRLAEEDGKKIPLPEKYEESDYSGKFTLRMPKSLHKMIAEQAEKEECSINQLIITYISMGLGNEFGKKQVSISFDGFNDIYQALVQKTWRDIPIKDSEVLFDTRDFYSRI